MGAEFRIVLFAIGALIVVYVLYDGYRRAQRKKQSAPEATDQKTGVEEGIDPEEDRVEAPPRLVTRQEPGLTALEGGLLASDASEEILAEELEGISAVQSSPELVITLHLMAKDAPFAGPKLLEGLITHGLRFGDMDIFHRYKHASGKGARVFSIANAVNPGTFDIEKMAEFSTPGIVLFLALPGPSQPLEAFELMLKVANQLEDILDGKLLDDQRTRLTEQMLRHYQDQIIEFERKTIAKERGLSVS